MLNGMDVIPGITDKRGAHWAQPSRKYIWLDEKYALMKDQTFRSLVEYSSSEPTGMYEGKMWKCRRGDAWYLRWFVDRKDLKTMLVESREIIVV